jgi:hypothetical protein
MKSDPPIEAPIRNSVDPIAHKARNHQTLPNFALLSELCITKHSSNDTAHRRQNGTFMAAVTIDAQSTPLIPELRKRSFRMFASARWQSSRLRNDDFLHRTSAGEELGEIIVSPYRRIFRNMNNSIVKTERPSFSTLGYWSIDEDCHVPDTRPLRPTPSL